jgi:hypothetical protein
LPRLSVSRKGCSSGPIASLLAHGKMNRAHAAPFPAPSRFALSVWVATWDPPGPGRCSPCPGRA